MSTRSGRHSPAGRDRDRRGADDLSAYGPILGEHEMHVFEYCNRLVGDEAEAASATQTALAAAQSLLADPGRLRAWLFALARQDILAKNQPSDQYQDAEVLDLVYRHGIRRGDLPAVLGVSAERAWAMLANAEALADALALADAEAEDDASADGDASGEAHVPTVAYAPAEIDGPAESDMLASPDEPGAVGEVGRATAPGLDPKPDSESMEAFTTLFDAYARNVFSYCSSLLGDEAEAAAATRATLIAACMLVERLEKGFRLRAWLLALARTECKSKDPGRAEPLPSDGLGLSELLSSWQRDDNEIADSGPRELNSDVEVSARLEGPVLAALSGLPAPQREVLELLYRHGVRPTELPAILGISADHAQTLLTDAVRNFEQSPWFPADTAEGLDKDIGPRQLAIEQLASLPLASLPASLWGRTFRAVFDPDAGSYRDAVAARLGPLRPDGFPNQQTLAVDPARKRVLLASLLLGAMLLTLAAGAALYSYFSG